MQIRGVTDLFLTAFVMATVSPSLRSKGSGDPTMCAVTPAAEGQTAHVSILFRKDINLFQDSVLAYLGRGDGSNTLSCHTAEAASTGMLCETDNPRYVPSAVVDRRLTVHLPNVSRAMAGVYRLEVYVNDVLEPVVSCSLVLIDAEGESPATSVIIGVVVLVLVLLVAGVMGVYYKRQQNKGFRSLPGRETMEVETYC